MSRRRRAARLNLPDQEWVAVEFVEDQQTYRCTAKRVLDCIKEPDLFNVVWSDDRKYAAKILKRGSKDYVLADDVELFQGIQDEAINPEAEDFRAEKQTSLFAKDSNMFVPKTQHRQNLHKESGTEDSNAEQFLKFREREWNDDISSRALREIRQRKFNAPVILLVVEDLVSLQNHLKEIGEEHFQKLSDDSSNRTSWYELSKILLTMVILFNRRRSVEASRMLLSHYLDRSKTPLHEDIGNALSDFEKQLCNNLIRFEVEGKTGKAVPVILTKNMKKYVHLLISTRNCVGVNPENLHLFARPYFNSKNSVTGSECLRKYAYECGAKHPEYITATRLRKHIATVSQVFNLTENEIELLCSHMGHDPKVHRNFYRLPEGTLQVAKLSRILIAMERGEAHLYKGKKLDEIEFNPDEVLEMDEDAQEEEDVVLEASEVFPGNENSEGVDEDMTEISSQNVIYSGSKEKKRATNVKKTTKCKDKQKVKHIQWTKEERSAVLNHLKSFVREGRVPGKQDCEKCKTSSAATLVRRDWKSIRFYVKNEITKRQNAPATCD